MSVRLRAAITVTLALLCGCTATVVRPGPSTSLNTCQSTVASAAKTYIDAYLEAVTGCLQAVAAEVVKDNAALTTSVASTCVSQFRNISDSRNMGKSLHEKLALAIARKCEPGMPNVTHTLADVLGTGAGVAEPLNAEKLNTWCRHFGGDGSIDTLNEWRDCVRISHECAALETISIQYPRVLAWLAEVRPLMQGLTPPSTDPAKIADALVGLDDTVAAIDRDGNGQPNMRCGAGGLVASGQTKSYGPGSDGDLQAGAPLSYTDNGDGTISDNNTGLMWEKKSFDASIHDRSNLYRSSLYRYPPLDETMNGTMVTEFLDVLNDVAGGGASCFAGHCDWRIPNARELESLDDYDPKVWRPTAFNSNCEAGCSVLTCSCGVDSNSSTSSLPSYFSSNYWPFHVHAVRGGL